MDKTYLAVYFEQSHQLGEAAKLRQELGHFPEAIRLFFHDSAPELVTQGSEVLVKSLRRLCTLGRPVKRSTKASNTVGSTGTVGTLIDLASARRSMNDIQYDSPRHPMEVIIILLSLLGISSMNSLFDV